MHLDEALQQCLLTLEESPGMWTARAYLNDGRTRVKATAKRYQGKRIMKKREYVVTIGRFDYWDRHNKSRDLVSISTQRLPIPRKKKNAKPRRC